MIAHGASRGLGSSKRPSPGRGERIWEINCYAVSFSRAHSSHSLNPRLTPWAIILRLPEANTTGA